MNIANSALKDEVEALSSIYGDEVVIVSHSSAELCTATLKPPNLPFSFLLSIPQDYPDNPPNIVGIQSTGNSRKGEGEEAVKIVRDVLPQVWTPGQVCLFDLVEEVSPLLEQLVHNDSSEVTSKEPTHETASTTTGEANHPHNHDSVSSIPAPQWTLSEPVTVNRSTFIAHACIASSLSDATDSISHLLSTNRKVASATHNITAWRIQTIDSQTGHQTTIQDCDDDGETAAGGRLLHLLQLMNVWNVVIVVSRWYGGVKLGPDRFRLINSVARDVLLNGGFTKNQVDKTKPKDKSTKK